MDMSFMSSFNSTQALLLVAIGIGAFFAVFGTFRALSGKSVAAQRMSPTRGIGSVSLPNASNVEDTAPTGLGAALIPTDENERREVAQALARAGFLGRRAVLNYYLIRIALGFGLPLLFSAVLYLSRSPDAPSLDQILHEWNDISESNATHRESSACIGFSGPGYWLKSKIKKRKQAIEEAFPNVLDLLQVGVEAGMGFDQALLKVASEIQSAAPEIAEEMIVLLSEIQAGRDRDRALMRMARRIGIDEMNSFVNVVMQSSRFGTSMSDALTTYAEEMRATRELKAEEKANKLPVQMSAVMALLMLPSLDRACAGTDRDSILSCVWLNNPLILRNCGRSVNNFRHILRELNEPINNWWF